MQPVPMPWPIPLDLLCNDDLTLVLGVLKDKEVDAIVNRLCPLAHKVIITRPDSPRAMDPVKLSEKFWSTTIMLQ